MKTFARYIGDGVYASFDGYQIILETERENGKHWLGLESEIMTNLKKYETDLIEHFENLRKNPINPEKPHTFEAGEYLACGICNKEREDEIHHAITS